MAYFNLEHEAEVIVEASPVGLGALLVQYDKDQNMSVITLASRALTDTERRYSQMEREALGVTWAILHFHLYLAGSSFCVVTDHKLLLALFNNTSSKPPTCIERWIMKLQEYDFKGIYTPGKQNPADFILHHPLPSTAAASREEKLADDYVNLVTYNAVPKTLQLEDIESETKKDEALILCKQAILENKWHVFRKNAPESIKQDIESLYRVRNELSISMEHDMRDRRIVIPESLRQRAIDIAHEGHQGIVKMKQLLRTKIWFPAIDRLVEQTVSACILCQALTVEKKSTEPLNMSELPNEPWEEISIDFKELPTGEFLLVVIDDNSRYPVIEGVRSTSATCIIPKLDTRFAAYGTPCVVRTDNGSPFNRTDFANFAKHLGFHHHKVTPSGPKPTVKLNA